ncbi:MAG TPA: helix-turn-helix domain-containing protein [Hyphomicrobiaceae bacterium]|nr:helix-turn-helix domain-containing protein [Hyphomicrobiaceae bacterium]
MLALLDQTPAPLVASEEEAAVARTAAERLRALAKAKCDVNIVIENEPNIVVPLPAVAVDLMFQILEAMGDRLPMTLIPHDAQLTTQQAADFLNVSRPYLIKLLEEGQIPHRKVGRHRRVRYADLHEFERKAAGEQRAAIDEMARLSRELDLD